MEPDFKEELIKLLTEYVESELKENGLVPDTGTLHAEIEFTVTEVIETAIESADDFINEKVEELTEEVADDDGVSWDPKEQWDTGKPSSKQSVDMSFGYGQSGRSCYGKDEVSGVSGGQVIDDVDRWKDAWGDN